MPQKYAFAVLRVDRLLRKEAMIQFEYRYNSVQWAYNGYTGQLEALVREGPENITPY